MDKKVFECETYVIWEKQEILKYSNGDFVLSRPRAKIIEAVVDEEKDIIRVRYHWFQEKLNNVRNDLIIKMYETEMC